MINKIRDAIPSDAATILRFITELAAYEKLAHEVEATVERVHETIFGAGAVARAVICEVDGTPAGFAIWFYSYSTRQARKALYLQDLYVSPHYRGSGAGKALLRHLASVARAEDCSGVEWCVLAWNERAIRVYDAVGAEPMSQCKHYRLAGTALQEFAAG